MAGDGLASRRDQRALCVRRDLYRGAYHRGEIRRSARDCRPAGQAWNRPAPRRRRLAAGRAGGWGPASGDGPHLSRSSRWPRMRQGGPTSWRARCPVPVAWRMGHEGEHLTVDARVHRLHLRHAAATLAEVPEGRLHGRLGRDRDGTWWGDALAFQSDDLTVTLHQGRVRLSPAETARFEVHTTVRAERPMADAPARDCRRRRLDDQRSE